MTIAPQDFFPHLAGLVASLDDVFPGKQIKPWFAQWEVGHIVSLVILGGSAIGLLASTSGRLYASVLYALQDTKTPFRFAVVRVALTISLGVLGAIVLPARLGLDPMWGIAGLSSSAGLAAWVEFLLLRRAVEARIGRSRVPWQRMALLWALAALAGAASFALSLRLAAVAPVQRGLLVVAMFGIVYLGLAMAVGVPEARALVRRVRRRRTS